MNNLKLFKNITVFIVSSLLAIVLAVIGFHYASMLLVLFNMFYFINIITRN